MTYNKYCPYCHRIVEHGRGAGTTKDYGSPFKICPHCHREYIDSTTVEPALAPYYEDFHITMVSPLGTGCGMFLYLLFLGFGVTFLLYGIIYSIFPSCPFWVIITIFAILVALILFYTISESKDFSEQTKKENITALERSKERLSDLSYVAKLRDAGIEVPDSALKHSQVKFDNEEDIEIKDKYEVKYANPTQKETERSQKSSQDT